MRTAWDAFQSGGETQAPEDILMSWRRSRWSGVDPLRTQIIVVDIDADSVLVRAAAPVLERVAGLLSGSACLALADASGRIVWRWVSEPRLDRALQDCHMREGGAFTEERVGTNGIGTALETRRSAVVVGAAHFVEAFHPWACVAAPVIHPITGRVHGAVNITCYSSEANQFLKAMVHEMADRVADQLLSGATVGERRLLDAYLLARRRTTTPVVALSAHTMIADDAASGWRLDHHETWQALVGVPDRTTVELGTRLFATVHRIDDGEAAVLSLYPANRSGDSLELKAVEDVTDPERSTTGLLERAEATVIAETLNACGGNKSAAAAELRISRTTLYQRLRRYRIDVLPPGT